MNFLNVLLNLSLLIKSWWIYDKLLAYGTIPFLDSKPFGFPFIRIAEFMNEMNRINKQVYQTDINVYQIKKKYDINKCIK